MRNPIAWLLVALIKLYRYAISPLFGQNKCKYYPSCSSYALEAIETFGVIKGSLKAIWRILRCNPWSKGGFDPVTPTSNQTKESCHHGDHD